MCWDVLVTDESMGHDYRVTQNRPQCFEFVLTETSPDAVGQAFVVSTSYVLLPFFCCL